MQNLPIGANRASSLCSSQRGVMALVSCSLAVMGCSSWSPLNVGDLKASAPRSVALVLMSPVTLEKFTPGAGLLTALIPVAGSMVMTARGKDLAKRYGLEDPAIQIRAVLLQYLSRGYGLEMRPSIDSSVGEGEPFVSHADLILRVRTVRWIFGRYVHEDTPDAFRLIYKCRVEVIDARRMKTIADGTCENPEPARDKTLTSDQYLANEAALLKSEIAKVEADCLAKFRTHLLRLPG